MSSSEDTKITRAGCACLCVLALVGLLCQSCLYQEVHTGTFKCIKTYTITSGSGDSVSTSKRVDLKPMSGPVETMRCDDAITLGQFNSATIYANFEVGKWYRVTARGPRNTVLSMFPNLTEAVEVTQ